jgi:hypothetical protein
MNITKSVVALAVGTVASIAISVPANAAPAPYKFANCDAMHRMFPHGVGLVGARDHTSGKPVTSFARAPRWYAKNSSSDRDKDNIACEAA